MIRSSDLSHLPKISEAIMRGGDSMKIIALVLLLIAYPVIERLTDMIITAIRNKIRKEVKN